MINQEEMVEKSIKQQSLYFALIGILATAVQYIFLVFFVEVFAWDITVSSSIGFIISAFLNYYLNYHYTFNSSSPHHQALPKFFTVAAIGLGLNTILMVILSERLELYYILAQIITTSLVMIWNFLANKFWSFRSKN